MNSFKAILFDADNTLFNNDGIHEAVTQEILTALGMEGVNALHVHEKWDEWYFSEQNRFLEEQGYCIDRENFARSLVLTLDDFEYTLTEDEAANFWQFMAKYYREKSTTFPEVKPFLTFLKKYHIKTAIVSNGDPDLIKERLQRANIEHHFEFIHAPCNHFPYSKPAKEIFLRSLDKIQAQSDQTIFVGDNPTSDIQGANEVGMFTVLIDRHKKHQSLPAPQNPDLRITDFSELQDFLKHKLEK
ncbi:MAG: HAD family hydrolase [Asgard group archaeon]|nr:HAD family hydrolase [Asgard group archaeon]